MVSYEESLETFKDVLHLLVKCKMCKKYMFCIYSEDIRDTCAECGGTHKVEYDLKEGLKE